MWRFLRNRRLILRLHYYLGTHTLWAHRAVVPAIARLLLFLFMSYFYSREYFINLGNRRGFKNN